MNMKKPYNEIYYLPMHIVSKEDRTTSKVRIVFDAPAKTTSGTSLNNQLLVGPMVHAPSFMYFYVSGVIRLRLQLTSVRCTVQL